MRSKLNDLYHHFLLWLNKHIKERTLLLFVCFLVGIATALASYMVKTSIHCIQTFLTENFTPTGANYFSLPAISKMCSRLILLPNMECPM